MKRLSFHITINAAASTVYTIMLGLKNKKTYEAWTALFSAGATYEGSWNKGCRIRFVGSDENGRKAGILSEIADHIPSRFVSIRHIGIVDGDQEIMEGPDLGPWVGGVENYHFQEHEGNTTLIVETDTIKEFESFFRQSWPKALEHIKYLAELAGDIA